MTACEFTIAQRGAGPSHCAWGHTETSKCSIFQQQNALEKGCEKGRTEQWAMGSGTLGQPEPLHPGQSAPTGSNTPSWITATVGPVLQGTMGTAGVRMV